MQVRPYILDQNGTLVHKYPEMQMSFQCVDDKGAFVSDGDCAEGGKGYSCPCPSVMLDDPRVKPFFGGAGLLPLTDPRTVAAQILRLAR